MPYDPTVTVYDLAHAFVCYHSDGSREGRIAFLNDDARRESAALEQPIGALALAIFGELYQEVVRDGFSTDEPEEFKAELIRRSRDPAAMQRFRQRVARVLN